MNLDLLDFTVKLFEICEKILFQVKASRARIRKVEKIYPIAEVYRLLSILI